MTSGSVTAIVVTFDSAHALPECLGALQADGVPALVVDNASTDDDRRDRRRAGRDGDPQRPQRGLWPRQQYRRPGGGQRVRARSSIRTVIVERGAVAALVDAARRYPDAAFFAPQIVEPSGRVFFQPRSLLAT